MSDTHTSNNWMTTIATVTTNHPGVTQAWAPAIDATTDRVGVVFEVKENCSITHAAIGVGAFAGNGGSFKFELWPMTAGTNGLPDISGTVLATTAAVSAYGNGYTCHEFAFTSPYSATAGQQLACIIVPQAGTDASNRTEWYYQGPDYNGTSALPAVITSTDSGSSYAIAGYDYWPGICLKTDKNFPLGGVVVVGSGALSPGSANDRYANKITIPAGEDIELHVRGIQVFGFYGLDDAEEIMFGVWDVDGAEVGNSERTVDGAQIGVGNSAGTALMTFLFDNAVKMVSGSTYYVGWKNITGAVQGYTYTMGKDGSAGPDYSPGGLAFGGEAFFWDDSDAETAWEKVQTGYEKRIAMNLLISDMHGGGNSVVITNLGKGDRGENFQDPSRSNSLKSGYQARSAGKIIKRSNGGYGWNPYA